MSTATQITVTQLGLTGARCPALFCSGLQPSDAPTADTVVTAISRAVQQFGVGGCAGRMAQEFGDHPDAAATRMRWVRQLIAQGPRPSGAGGGMTETCDRCGPAVPGAHPRAATSICGALREPATAGALRARPGHLDDGGRHATWACIAGEAT